MNLAVNLSVWLKGVDLVASTAEATLLDKMGYEGRLLGLRRLDVYAFSVGADIPGAVVERLQRFFAIQSSFYNRNKHNYFLEFIWGDQTIRDGRPLAEIDRYLQADAGRAARDFNGQNEGKRVILKNVPIYRTDVLVEDLEETARAHLAARLEDELAGVPVRVSDLGTCWLLALRAGTAGEARGLAEEITVTQSRDRGLLLNPNNQGFRVLSTQTMDIAE